MKKYTKRLEVRLEPWQIEKLMKESAERQIPVGEIIREAINKKYSITKEEKIAEAHKMFQLDAPVKEWKEMKKEIEEGIRK